jgi:arginyl-tRNA synthetase
MVSLRRQLALLISGLLDVPAEQLLLLPTKEAKFGEYQVNGAMAFAKKEKANPRQVATLWLEKLAPALAEVADLELAGPGFINLTLKTTWLAQRLLEQDLTAWDSGQSQQRVLVEYSSPNVAKEMHVGHIRSTILGDCVARICAFAGHEVIRQNHLGDWGTQFGMLCTHLQDHPQLAAQALEGGASIGELYRQAYARFSSDPEFEARARAKVVELHQGEAEALALWEQVVEHSRRHFEPLYRRLGVLLTRADECGESHYRHELPSVVQWLRDNFGERRNGLEVKLSDGAVCAFHYDETGNPLFLNAEKEVFPFLIQKSDGAFLYATTDLAAMRYRVRELAAKRIIVLTDARQALHFQMLIATAQKAGWLDGVVFEHITFGTILGPDRKPLKARSGEAIQLADLLQEAVDRARQLLLEREQREREKHPQREGYGAEEMASMAEAIGIGSIKYADLSQNRSTDYVFQWEKMLSFEGNTAPYLMYALARTRSILRRAEAESVAPLATMELPQERALAMQLLRFGEALEQVSQEWRVHFLADYLYQLAGALMDFYEGCPVLKAEPEIRAQRLWLLQRVATALEQGLRLLGLTPLERM